MSCCTPKAPTASPALETGDIRDRVRERYAHVALTTGEAPCCGTDCHPVEASEAIGYTADELASIPGDANPGVGCGNPTAVAEIREGETIVDLGSGGGIDCFLAAKATGPNGRVIGIDMTDEMLERARRGARDGGFSNVEFRKGFIEELPLDDASADLVISNCVINLSPDKPRVFREVYRALKPGGRLVISDIVVTEALPEAVQRSIEAYVGCIAGALHIDDYLDAIRAAGFSEVEVISKNSYGSIVTADRDLVARFAAELGTDAASVGRWASAVTSLRVRAVK
ncbi:MAG: arsenite methyltransferase [Acidobacteria bacterium]|nr:arsenite methyltransferase [Acidobacteriota bacterium]